MAFFSLGISQKDSHTMFCVDRQDAGFQFSGESFALGYGSSLITLVVDFVSETGCLVLAGLELTMKPRMALNF